MLFKLILLFTLIPLVELYLLIEVGGIIGTLPTVGLVVLTGVVGGLLAKSQGVAVLRRIRTELNQGRLPAAGLLDGVLILIAGALLMTPGLLTDAAGFALLIPFTRRLLRQWLKAKLMDKLARGEVQIHVTPGS